MTSDAETPDVLPPEQSPAVVARDLFAHEAGGARDRILALEAAMFREIGEGNLVENTKAMPLEHMFVPGAYARSLTIPAGSLIVGKIHKHACMNFVERGEITVLTEIGTKTITAPAFFPSEAGVKRVGLAHADTVWITVHPTDLTDLVELEKALTADSYEEYLMFKAPEQGVLQ